MPNSAAHSCRLCLSAQPSESAEPEVLRCFGPNVTQPAKKATVADVLNQHFWFELHAQRDADALVCRPCWSSVDTFHQFYVRVLAAYAEQKTQLTSLVVKTDVDEDDEFRTPHVGSTEVEVVLSNQDTYFIDCSGNGDCVEAQLDDNVLGTESLCEPAKATKRRNSSETEEPPAKRKRPLRSRARVPSADIVKTEPKTATQSDDCDGPAGTDGVLPTDSAGRFRCPECPSVHAKHIGLAIHMTRIHGKQVQTKAAPASDGPTSAQRQADDELLLRYVKLECTDCALEFPRFGLMLRHHKREHQRTSAVWCCGKRFDTRQTAFKHCQWHDNPRQFDCPTCAKNFTNAAAVAAHIERRHPTAATAQTHLCTYCGAEYSYRGKLYQHMRRVHLTAGDPTYECFVCHRTFHDKYALRGHASVHTDERAFVCAQCGSRFKTQLILDQHVQYQHSSGPQQCAECGLWVLHVGALKGHMRRVHRDTKPVRCPLCDHVAPTRRAYGAHRRQVHYSQLEHKHRCRHGCDRTFAKLKALREHEAIHLGIDLYRCAYCPATFRFDSLLYTHRKKVHGAELERDRAAKAEALVQMGLAAQAAKEERGKGAIGGQ